MGKTLRIKTNVFPQEKHAAAGLQGGSGRWYIDSDSRNVSNTMEFDITSFGEYDIDFYHHPGVPGVISEFSGLSSASNIPDILWVNHKGSEGIIELHFGTGTSSEDRMYARLGPGESTFFRLNLPSFNSTPSAWKYKQVNSGETASVKFIMVYE